MRGVTSWAFRCAEPINLGWRINSKERSSPTLGCVKAFGAMEWERRERQDITDRAVAMCCAGLADSDSEGLAFQTGSELDESVYSATISDIPSSCLKKSL